MVRAMKTLRALTIGLILATTAATARATPGTCVQISQSPTAGQQMTSFSVNTGTYPVEIWNKPGMLVYGFFSSYEGPIVIGWVPEFDLTGGANLGAQALVIVPQSRV